MSEHIPHIVILDDDYHVLSPYIEELECLGYQVSACGDVEEFVDVLSNTPRVDLFIIDVMLPIFGSGFSELATNQGQKTGLMVGKSLREKGIETPIIFFSVAWLEGMINEIKDTEKRVKNSIYLKKLEVMPEDLALLVRRILEKGSVPGKLSKAYRKLADSLLLKPGIFGIGIDLKRLLR